MHKRYIVGLLIVFETMVFLTFYYREVAWYPSPYYDQSVYLSRSYAIQEGAMNNGLYELLHPLIERDRANGVAFPAEGAILGLFLPIPRLSRLCVGFVAFALLQICLYSTACTLWRRTAYGFAALGLVLCQSTMWFEAGGLFDYRIDFLAYCLYGIWICFVLRSNLFEQRKWALASSLIGIVLVLNRFLTMVYLSGVLLGFGALITVFASVRKFDALKLNLRQRLGNLATSSGVLLAGTAPFLILNARAIYRYYVVGHFTGPEKYVRAKENAITGLVEHLLYYPKSIVSDHLGLIFLAGALIALFAAGSRRSKVRLQNIVSPSGAAGYVSLLEAVFLLGAIVGPLLVLTCDISKSPIVGGIVGVPCALLVLWLLAVLAGESQESGADISETRLGMIAGLIVGLGCLNQLAHGTRHLPAHSDPEQYQQIAELNRWLANQARRYRLARPTISTDVISDWFTAPTITASAFEQTGQLVQFSQLLGRTITGPDRSTALAEIRQSDYVILTTLPKLGAFDFYEQIHHYWDEIKSWSDENLLLARSVPFEDYTLTIYARPLPRLRGISGRWITSRGVDVEVETSTLKRFPVIRLAGITNFRVLSKSPDPSVWIQLDKRAIQVPATLERENEDHYSITIDASSLPLVQTEVVRFHISFDVFFVPKALGQNNDTRELVIRAPLRVEMHPKRL